MDHQFQLLTIAEAARRFQPAGFTESSLRWLAFNRQTNGFEKAFLKVGRRVLIDEPAFVAAIRSGAARP